MESDPNCSRSPSAFTVSTEMRIAAPGKSASHGSVAIVACAWYSMFPQLAVGRSILLESALSFFGVGVQPPTASWGNMLYQAQATMATEPWLALFPGAAILISVLTVNALGERLQMGSDSI